LSKRNKPFPLHERGKIEEKKLGAKSRTYKKPSISVFCWTLQRKDQWSHNHANNGKTVCYLLENPRSRKAKTMTSS